LNWSVGHVVITVSFDVNPLPSPYVSPPYDGPSLEDDESSLELDESPLVDDDGSSLEEDEEDSSGSGVGLQATIAGISKSNARISAKIFFNFLYLLKNFFKLA
jgi:hypothetical protein